MNIKFQSMKVIYYVICIISLIQITSCKKEPAQVITPTPTPTPSGNRPPVANAVPDQTITLSTNSKNHYNFYEINTKNYCLYFSFGNANFYFLQKRIIL